jgi:DNA-binding MarR family transcriptional regulator
MDIREEIKSSGFISTFHQAIVNIYFTSNWIIERQNPHYQAYDLLPQHFNVLVILRGKAPLPCSAKEIKEILLDKGRDLTRLVDKLVRMGLVRREVNPENRRQMHIWLTEDGLALVSELDEKIMQEIRSIDCLSQEESQELNRLLDKIRSCGEK